MQKLSNWARDSECEENAVAKFRKLHSRKNKITKGVGGEATETAKRFAELLLSRQKLQNRSLDITNGVLGFPEQFRLLHRLAALQLLMAAWKTFWGQSDWPAVLVALYIRVGAHKERVWFSRMSEEKCSIAILWSTITEQSCLLVSCLCVGLSVSCVCVCVLRSSHRWCCGLNLGPEHFVIWWSGVPSSQNLVSLVGSKRESPLRLDSKPQKGTTLVQYRDINRYNEIYRFKKMSPLLESPLSLPSSACNCAVKTFSQPLFWINKARSSHSANIKAVKHSWHVLTSIYSLLGTGALKSYSLHCTAYIMIRSKTAGKLPFVGPNVRVRKARTYNDCKQAAKSMLRAPGALSSTESSVVIVSENAMIVIIH